MRSKKVGAILQGLLVVAAVGSLPACGGGGDGGGAPVAPSVNITSLAPADIGLAYSRQLTANGTGPLKWELQGGTTLPAGLTLSDAGLITGTPTAAIEKTISLKVSGPGGTATKDNIVFVVRGNPHRVSVVSESLAQTSGGEAGNAQRNGRPRISDPGINNTGRYVVFHSTSADIVPGKSGNGKNQVYLHDRETGKTELISAAVNGNPGNDDSVVAVVSDDGNFVAFDSWASDLVTAATNGSNDTNSWRDVFLRDRANQRTIRVSQGAAGAQGICSAPNSDDESCNSFDPSISADGKVIAFGSLARLSAADIDDAADIYVMNLRGGAPVLTLVTKTGSARPASEATGGPSLSADGNYVVFSSDASTLGGGTDSGQVSDIFRADLSTATPTIKKITLTQAAGEANGASIQPTINGDGSIIAFASSASDLVAGVGGGVNQIYVATNLGAATPAVKHVSVSPSFADGNGNSGLPALSRDGKFVAFHSEATNLDGTNPDANNATDVFVLQIGVAIKRVSGEFLNGGGFQEGNGLSQAPAINQDGSLVIYYSDATNLVTGDTNGVRDAFVVRR